ncbi:MAG: hypothetical protein ACJ0FI_05985 [Gammaproteobacteria bacterium]|jgi:hypothetical protein
MKNILLTFILVFGSFSFAMHHEKDEFVKPEPTFKMALLSTYELGKGSSYGALQREMIQYQKDQVKSGYSACGLYKHEFGSIRGFYTYCYFNDLEHFASIMDSRGPDNLNERQNFASHTDHIVNVQERNLTAGPPYVVYVKYVFASSLSINEADSAARKIFEVYNTAFGGCNMFGHYWGPENATYFTCGYENYSDFAVKSTKVSEIMVANLADVALHVVSHSDDLLSKVDLN